MRRLFVAYTLSSKVKATLAQYQQKFTESKAKLRLLAPEDLHLTIKFLGAVQDELFEEVRFETRRLAGELGSTELTLDSLLIFPERGVARIICAGTTNSSEQVLESAEWAERIFSSLGYQESRREFVPHITLARVRSDTTKGALRKLVSEIEVTPITIALNEIALYESRKQGSGARYAPVDSYAL